MHAFYGATRGGRRRSDRRGRQHKRHRGDHRLVRILTARHRAVHHAAHVVPIMAAVFTSCGTGWSLLVMMLWNIAKAVGAARHGVTRPGGSRERHIERHDAQQAHERGDNSASIWGAAVHRLHSTYVGIICPIDSRARENCRAIVTLQRIVTSDGRAKYTVSHQSDRGMLQLLPVCKLVRKTPKTTQVPPPS
jgi:hypothetical protein